MSTGPVERQIGWPEGAPTGADPDPLGEEACSPVPGLVQRYPDRALVLVTRRCFIRCAFCTRLHFVREGGRSGLAVDVEGAVRHIGSRPDIREVLVSGGDPLTLDDGTLGALLSAIRAVPHVRLIRLATRAPMARPERITEGLCAMLASLGPMHVAVHFNHPDELTAASLGSLARLVDAGLPVLNQAVLLAGVNDDGDVLAELCLGLAEARVRPYYVLQCDRVAGTERFWVPLRRALSLTAGLEHRLPGHAVPAFVVDLPGWEGKARLGPGARPRKVAGGYMIAGRSGREIFYPD